MAKTKTTVAGVDEVIYSAPLQVGVTRMEAATGKVFLGRTPPTVAASDPQLKIVGGSAGTPNDGLVIGVYGHANQSLKLNRAETSPSDLQVKMIWNKASVAGWSMFTDSGLNGTCDWSMANTGTGHTVMYFNTDDSVTMGAVTAGSGFKVLSPKLGVFNTAPVAQQANASQTDITAVTDTHAKAALQALYNLLAAYGLAPATA